MYMAGHGVQPAWSIHLSCRDMYILTVSPILGTYICYEGWYTNYHNNFSMHNGIQTYYLEKPKYIQVGEHQFVEDKVIMMWTGQMLLGWYVVQ